MVFWDCRVCHDTFRWFLISKPNTYRESSKMTPEIMCTSPKVWMVTLPDTPCPAEGSCTSMFRRDLPGSCRRYLYGSSSILSQAASFLLSITGRFPGNQQTCQQGAQDVTSVTLTKAPVNPVNVFFFFLNLLP